MNLINPILGSTRLIDLIAAGLSLSIREIPKFGLNVTALQDVFYDALRWHGTFFYIYK